MQSWGFAPDGLQRSFRSSTARGETGEVKEHSIGTPSLLLWLCQTAVARGTSASVRLAAVSLLSELCSWFERLDPALLIPRRDGLAPGGSDMISLRFESRRLTESSRRDLEVGDSQFAACLRGVLDSCPGGPVATPLSLPWLLAGAYFIRSRPGCSDLVKASCFMMFSQVAGVVEAIAQEMAYEGLVPALHGKVRCRRIDPTTVYKVTTSTPKGVCLLRAGAETDPCLGPVGRQSAPRWARQGIDLYVSKGRRLAQGCNRFAIASDASTFYPGEETLVAAAQCLDGDFPAFYLPFQAWGVSL